MALTASQRKVLRELMAAPSYRAASPKARKALIEAGLVESNLSTPNQANSDRDSEGALQQRPSSGWGPTTESNTTDAEQFLRRAIPLAGKYSSAGQLAQAVQRSAFPGRYDQRGSEAAALMGMRGGSAASSASATTTEIPGQTISTTIPTVDKAGFEQARKLALVGGLIARRNPNSFLIRSGLLSTQEPSLSDFVGSKTVKDVIPGATVRTPAGSSVGSSSGTFGKSHSPLLELIHNTGSGPGFGVKNGQKVNGSQVFAGVWAGHKTHVHVAAGPKTVVQLGKLAQQMGLHVGENPHFGGVNPVHVPGSYHYKGEAIDVSGDPQKMNTYARRVEQLYGIH